MGQKTLPSQRRGAARPKYLANRKLGVSPARYPSGITQAVVKVLDFRSDPLRDAILAKVSVSGDTPVFIIAHHGAYVGEIIDNSAEIPNQGSVMQLGKIPDGTKVYNIENRPGDGGQLCRSPGSCAIVKQSDSGRVIIKMPSKKLKTLLDSCLVTVGSAAGAGRGLKPLLKAGAKFHSLKRRCREWPFVSRNSKNVKDHKFGGSGKKRPGSSTTCSRHAPPGAKVGSIAAKRTGDK
jgi:large subunit ribosomal protein L2